MMILKLGTTEGAASRGAAVSALGGETFTSLSISVNLRAVDDGEQ